MTLNWEKFLRMRYLIIWTIVSTILAGLFAVLVIVVYRDSGYKVDAVVDRMTYIKERQSIDRVITESDRYMKVTTFYSKIIAHYGQKFHPKYNDPEKWKHQGLSKEQISDINDLWYRGARAANVPYFALPSIAIMESSINPLSRTYWEDGKIKEAGLYNQRRSAVIYAKECWDRMPANLQKLFAFKFDSMEDLFDPINATKVAFCLVWHEYAYYQRNPAWAITSVHWGNYRISRYYHSKVLPPTKFKFNVGTLKEDVRSPFTYYFWWNAYNSQFEMFDIRVYVDKHWAAKYKELCSREEREYLNSMKYFKELVKLYDTLEKDKKEYEAKREKNLRKMEMKIRNMNEEYIKTQRVLKSGDFKSFKDVIRLNREQLRAFLKQVRNDKNQEMKKWIYLAYGFVIFVILVLCPFGLVYIIVLIRRLVRYRKLKKKRLENQTEDPKT